ncbi:MAG: SDR family NAD(P)-dependent oxidoreductase, partial [Nevskiales bacterium]
MTHLKDRRIVITGGGSGLGRAIALRFARKAWRIAIADINEEGAEETLRQVERNGGSGFVQKCNVREVADFEALAQRLRKEWNGVDVVVNNAGIASAGSVVESRYSDWDATMDINLMGVVRGCRELVPLLLEQGAGHVVNTASFAAIATPPSMAAYNVSKAAVVALSESLRAEVIDEGVDVSVACPSFFKTNLTDSML